MGQINMANEVGRGEIEGFRQSIDGPHNWHILITGPSGSGKTYLSNVLKLQGINTYDADKVVGLTGWFDKSGGAIEFPSEAGKDFLDDHAFLWNREVLVDFLFKHPSVYMFGISRNVFEMIDLFHRVYFLQVPQAVLTERLQAADRDNPMGGTAYQIEYSLMWARRNEEKAQTLGVPMIDGTLPAERILSQIREGVSAWT